MQDTEGLCWDADRLHGLFHFVALSMGQTVAGNKLYVEMSLHVKMITEWSPESLPNHVVVLKKKKEVVSQVESQGIPNPNEQLCPGIKAEGDPSGQQVGLRALADI